MSQPPQPAPPTPAPTSPEGGPRPEPTGPWSVTPPLPASPTGPWSVAVEPPGSSTAVALWREYYTEVADRWYLLHLGRRGTLEEIMSGVSAESGKELTVPNGELLVVRRSVQDATGAAEVAGCAGVRLIEAGTAELTRVYVCPALRRAGAGRTLLAAAEASARRLGARRLRLDTRLDLVEALALYRHRGFTEIPAYNAGPYAETWWEKQLD